jgi:hypothetical protein
MERCRAASAIWAYESRNDGRFRVNNVVLLLAFVSVATAGCAATVKPMTTPEGKKGFLVECDGSADSWASCYEAATKACQGKYTVLDRNETSTATAYGPLVRRNLIAECKNE